jgi:hypothetical protein
MSEESKRCVECFSEMEAGFVIDLANKAAYQLMWHAGVPDDISKHGFEKDFESLDRSKIAFVNTFRCTKCGLLKSYAHFDD